MRITTDDGVELAVEVAGHGPGLMLVHGYGGAKEDFSDHIDALGRTHQVVIFDHRGHGASDKPDDLGAYSFDRLVLDTLQVADALDLDRFRLLGHSMGGMVARKVAIEHTDRLDALIMMDTAPGPIPGFDASLMDIAADHAMEEGKDALKELLDLAEVLETPAYKLLLEQRPGYQEFVAKKWNDMSVVMWAAMARQIAHQTDDLPAMARLTLPLLVLVGAQDGAFVEASHTMVGAIPGAQLVVIPDAGHSPQMENPREWFDALDGFLASLPARAR